MANNLVDNVNYDFVPLTVDSQLDSSSTNPVQNRAVSRAIDAIGDGLSAIYPRLPYIFDADLNAISFEISNLRLDGLPSGISPVAEIFASGAEGNPAFIRATSKVSDAVSTLLFLPVTYAKVDNPANPTQYEIGCEWTAGAIIYCYEMTGYTNGNTSYTMYKKYTKDSP